jgi:hypothetical protein
VTEYRVGTKWGGASLMLRRWVAAMLGALAAFVIPWWAWMTWRLPPGGGNQLSVALGVAAVLSTIFGAPLFW